MSIVIVHVLLKVCKETCATNLRSAFHIKINLAGVFVWINFLFPLKHTRGNPWGHALARTERDPVIDCSVADYCAGTETEATEVDVERPTLLGDYTALEGSRCWHCVRPHAEFTSCWFESNISVSPSLISVSCLSTSCFSFTYFTSLASKRVKLVWST